MTTKTRSDLVSRALGKLGVLQAGQIPSDEDASAVDGYVDGTLATLSGKDIVTVNDQSNIDESLFDHIATILKNDAATEFSLPYSAAEVQNAENMLRVIVRVRPTRAPLIVDYF